MAVTLRDYLFNCYRSRHGSYTNFRNRNWEPRNFTPSVPFTRYIKVPLDRDVIEVPCIYKYKLQRRYIFQCSACMMTLQNQDLVILC